MRRSLTVIDLLPKLEGDPRLGRCRMDGRNPASSRELVFHLDGEEIAPHRRIYVPPRDPRPRPCPGASGVTRSSASPWLYARPRTASSGSRRRRTIARQSWKRSSAKRRPNFSLSVTSHRHSGTDPDVVVSLCQAPVRSLGSGTGMR
jgi:hypothetical protein